MSHREATITGEFVTALNAEGGALGMFAAYTGPYRAGASMSLDLDHQDGIYFADPAYETLPENQRAITYVEGQIGRPIEFFYGVDDTVPGGLRCLSVRPLMGDAVS